MVAGPEVTHLVVQYESASQAKVTSEDIQHHEQTIQFQRPSTEKAWWQILEISFRNSLEILLHWTQRSMDTKMYQNSLRLTFEKVKGALGISLMLQQ